MKVLTLNSYLMPFSKDRSKRRKKLIVYLLQGDFDVINLQEVWSPLDISIIHKALKEYNCACPTKSFFNKSGLVTFYKGKLLKESFHKFPLKKRQLWDNLVHKGYHYMRIKNKGKTVSIVNTHLPPFFLPKIEEVNSRYVKDIEGFVAKEKVTVITGDFNLRLKDMKKACSWKYVKTSKTFRKNNKYNSFSIDDTLDYVFYKGLKVRSKSLVKDLSDHYGISVEFE